MNVCIGTSGFGIGREKYLQSFSCVEVQHTFYQPPQISTLERWRENAPPEFEFVLKAWQLITHDAKSPTYRRLKRKLSDIEKEEAGYFRPTEIVMDAWRVTLECARALRAKTILFQCPASFTQTGEHIRDLKNFFEQLHSTEAVVNFCWEPRGDWNSSVVKALCEELDLWHVVDPFASESVTPSRSYFRLHGRGGWRYEYEESELLELASMVKRNQGGTNVKTPYVFFNNVRMTKDALHFKAIVEPE